jgi:glycosyltransferase involved in cell wall biosynthesis
MQGREAEEASLSDTPSRVLFVSTRELGGRGTGRLSVLRTHVRALAALGHEVHVAVVAPEAPADDEWTRRHPTTHVPPPSTARTAVSALRTVVTGRGTLNEALFVDRSVRRRVRDLARESRADVVVLDSLRLSRCAEDLPVPAVVDLDDLLSLRYADMRSRGADDPAAVLGFAAARVPSRLRTPAGRAATLLLGLEARRTARREVEVAHRAAAVSLVARQEVDELARRSGRPVAWLPPAVGLPEDPAPQADGLVFLGGLDYLPNLQSLDWYRDEVLPHLDPADPRHVLHVVGACPEEARRRLDVPGMVLHGYVDDLAAALSRRVLVAPLVAGGGIKLKVLDGMAHGLPVVGTPAAFAGLPLPEELHLVAEDGAAFARLVRDLVDDPERCTELGRLGRDLVAEHFVLTAASRRWREVLTRVSA